MCTVKNAGVIFATARCHERHDTQHCKKNWLVLVQRCRTRFFLYLHLSLCFGSFDASTFTGKILPNSHINENFAMEGSDCVNFEICAKRNGNERREKEEKSASSNQIGRNADKYLDVRQSHPSHWQWWWQKNKCHNEKNCVHIKQTASDSRVTNEVVAKIRRIYLMLQTISTTTNRKTESTTQVNAPQRVRCKCMTTKQIKISNSKQNYFVSSAEANFYAQKKFERVGKCRGVAYVLWM